MNILITGITGYIGSNLARALCKSHCIYGVVRMPVNITYIKDIQDKLTLLPYDGSGVGLLCQIQQCKPDLVYHLATYYTNGHAMEQVEQLISSNITFGAQLLEAMASQGVQNLVYTTSIMQHYRGEDYCPLNLYAATKRAFSDLMAYYVDAGLLRHTTVVLSDTYGPGDQRPKILNQIRSAAESNTPVDLSDGTQDYDLVYIDDVVDALIRAGEGLYIGKWENQIFQIGAKEVRSLRETVEAFLNQEGLQVPLHWGARPNGKREIRTAIRLFPPVPDEKSKLTQDLSAKIGDLNGNFI